MISFIWRSSYAIDILIWNLNYIIFVNISMMFIVVWITRSIYRRFLPQLPSFWVFPCPSRKILLHPHRCPTRLSASPTRFPRGVCVCAFSSFYPSFISSTFSSLSSPSSPFCDVFLSLIKALVPLTCHLLRRKIPIIREGHQVLNWIQGIFIPLALVYLFFEVPCQEEMLLALVLFSWSFYLRTAPMPEDFPKHC